MGLLTTPFQFIPHELIDRSVTVIPHKAVKLGLVILRQEWTVLSDGNQRKRPSGMFDWVLRAKYKFEGQGSMALVWLIYGERKGSG